MGTVPWADGLMTAAQRCECAQCHCSEPFGGEWCIRCYVCFTELNDAEKERADH